MKRLAGFYCLAALSGCIENPGVDRELATRHDRGYHSEYINNGLQIGLRLNRENEITRIYLGNSGTFTIDSLTLFAQIAVENPPPHSSEANIKWPVFHPDGLMEKILDVRGLRPGEEFDLGALSPAFSGKVDELNITLIPIRYAGAGKAGGVKRSGGYQGRLERIGPMAGPETDSADIRGIIDQWGHFFLWAATPGTYDSFRGRLEGDTLRQANYAYIDYMRGQYVGGIALRDSAGSLIIALGTDNGSGRDSLRVVLTRAAPETLSGP